MVRHPPEAFSTSFHIKLRTYPHEKSGSAVASLGSEIQKNRCTGT